MVLGWICDNSQFGKRFIQMTADSELPNENIANERHDDEEENLDAMADEFFAKRAARAREKVQLIENQKRFSDMSRQELSQRIRPKWDLNANALSSNLTNLDFFPNGYSLLEASNSSWLSEMHSDFNYDVNLMVPSNRDEHKIIRILSEWEVGKQLTAPILGRLDDKIAICDGMHRLSVCTYLQSTPIPFYVERHDEEWFVAITGAKLIERGEWPTRTS